MRENLAEVAERWLNLLPVWPTELNWAKSNATNLPTADVLRWLRFHLSQRSESDFSVAKLHLHFGFGSAAFRQQLFQGLELLLSIEAAQYSLAGWPDLTTWLRDNAPAGKKLAVFNLLQWQQRPEGKPLYWPLRELEKDAGAQPYAVYFGEAGSTISLPFSQPVLYESREENDAESPIPGTRLRAYYSPAAGASASALTQGTVAGPPLPVAIWAPKGHGPDLAEAGLRAANSAGTGPLLWRMGRASAATAVARTVLLKRSSVLFFFGRVPAVGAYNAAVSPAVRLVLSTTMRPRPLRWNEVPHQVRTMQVGPAQAAWFGLPAARVFTYEAPCFYATENTAREQELALLLTDYATEQNQENEDRAGRDDDELLAPLPWNLLHWVRDAATAQAVAAHKAQEYVRLHIGPDRKGRLTRLLTEITGLLAELRPLWQQLRALPAGQRAYAVVPIHLAQPAYLPGWRPLARDLRPQPVPELAHLTFISLSELARTAENPTWPIYITTVEPRYWWALRQLPAETDVRWLLHRGLLHNSFCHALRRQHEQERDALHRQLWPFTALAPDPAQAATVLAAELQATEDGLNLPLYTAPMQFRRVGADQPLPTDPVLNTPPVPMGARPTVRREAVATTWPEVSVADRAAARAVGRIAADASAAELDEAVLYATADALTPDERDQAACWQQLEEEAAVLETEDVFIAPNSPLAGSTLRGPEPAPRLAGAVTLPRSRLVWWHRPQEADGLWHRTRLNEVPTRAFYLDEQRLRQTLRRESTVAAALPDVQNGLPRWKEALRDYAMVNNPGHPERLHRKMEAGSFGGQKLDLSYPTFLRDYLAWDQNFSPLASATRLPHTWQNRGVVAQVVGTQYLDEMQLMRRDKPSGDAAEGEHLRQARTALLAWWQQGRAARAEGTNTAASLGAELATFVAANPADFSPAFDETGAGLGQRVSEYFRSVLVACFQEKTAE